MLLKVFFTYLIGLFCVIMFVLIVIQTALSCAGSRPALVLKKNLTLSISIPLSHWFQYLRLQLVRHLIGIEGMLDYLGFL